MVRYVELQRAKILLQIMHTTVYKTFKCKHKFLFCLFFFDFLQMSKGTIKN